jgi:DNA-binding CsgD family transcriptional regulator
LSREQIALQLIERIYQAALDPSLWDVFVSELSQAYDNATAGFALQMPGSHIGSVMYGVGFQPSYGERFARHMAKGLPWDEARSRHWVGRFGLAADAIPDAEIAKSEIYHDWMKPQGFAPSGPMGHTVARDDHGRPLASVILFRMEGQPAFEARDLELVDMLVPHLARAYSIHTQRHESAAMAEALDRIPTGMVLIDPSLRPVLTNHMARTLFDLDDGLSMGETRPRAWKRDDDKVLEELMRIATSPKRDRTTGTGVMSVTRPSGRRAFTVMLAPLLEGQAESTLHDAVAMMTVSDLDRGSFRRTDSLRTLYGLTEAESELVNLLCEGLSLEEAANRRSVTVNTARSQLKQVFSKTSTSRQSELMRLVLVGIPPTME